MAQSDDSDCLRYLRALSDESRWRIVRLLTSLSDPLTLGDLAARLELSDYNASRHVHILAEVGIVTISREGRFKWIGIAPGFRSRIRSQPDSAVLDIGCCRFDFSQQIATPAIQEMSTDSPCPGFGEIQVLAAPARYIMIGGFLGAGKTTAVAALARHLSNLGKRVGLITNDQGRDLVDTRMLRSRGFATEEIAGGCFCCKFNSVVDAAARLTREARPEVIIAEPVGSCIDLVSTVTYPLRRIYGDQFSIAPVSVLVDPMRARRILGLEEGRSFSEKILYIYRKQLEEADIIVIAKSDLLDPASESQLRDALGNEFPQARILSISARQGKGLDTWFEILDSEDQICRPGMEVDYDTYAEGEALLGWLNATINVKVSDEVDSSLLLENLARELRCRLESRQAEVAHLKMTLSPDNALAGEVAVINLVRNDLQPEVCQQLEEPITGGQIVLNLRAECDPELLAAMVEESVATLSGDDCRLSLDHLERFRPARPTPSHPSVKRQGLNSRTDRAGSGSVFGSATGSG